MIRISKWTNPYNMVHVSRSGFVAIAQMAGVQANPVI